MLALYLFTVVFVSLCLLIAEPEPRNFTFASEETYETITALDTFPWITNFVAEVSLEPESNTITADPKPTSTSITEVTVEPELAKTDELDARVKEITSAMTKAEILSEIKSHGWWEPNLSRMSKKELAQVKATREN